MRVILLLLVLAAARPNALTCRVHDSVDSTDTLAARIAVEMLQISAGASVMTQRKKLFAVGDQMMTREELVRFLVALGKPTRCAMIVDSEKLIVRCARIDAPPFVNAQRQRASGLDDWRTRIASFGSLDPRSEPRVLIMGAGASFLVPLGALELFLRDYRIVGSLALFEPTPPDRGAGAHARVEIRRAAGVQFLGSLPDK